MRRVRPGHVQGRVPPVISHLSRKSRRALLHVRIGRANAAHFGYRGAGMTASAVTLPSPLEPAAALIVRVLPLHAAVYGTLAAIDYPTLRTKVLAVVLWGAAGLALRFQAARGVSFLACVLLTVHLFPLVPNHGYLLCLALFIGALFQTKSTREISAIVEAFRYLAAIVWFWSGVQKAWSGTWSHGQLLAYEIGHSPRFAPIFGWLTTRSERHAFRSNGPFMANATLTMLGCSIWILEIGIGIGLLLLPSRYRKHCTWAAIALLLGIEIVARESIFGVLMLALLVPSLDTRLRKRYLLCLLPLELLTLGGRLSFIPGGFH